MARWSRFVFLRPASRLREKSSPGTQRCVRVDDVDAHHAHAAASGARILRPPADYPYGERQYTALDLAGHVWTFSQSIADVDPADWGGELVGPIPART